MPSTSSCSHFSSLPFSSSSSISASRWGTRRKGRMTSTGFGGGISWIILVIFPLCSHLLSHLCCRSRDLYFHMCKDGDAKFWAYFRTMLIVFISNPRDPTIAPKPSKQERVRSQHLHDHDLVHRRLPENNILCNLASTLSIHPVRYLPVGHWYDDSDPNNGLRRQVKRAILKC